MIFASGKEMSVTDFDWDDTLLIREYDRIMGNAKSSKSKGKVSCKKEKKADKEPKSSKLKDEMTRQMEKQREKEPWVAGDYCRAVYEDDGRFYEARIIAIEGDFCEVEYLGYGDVAVVKHDDLQESLGQKARKKQRKKAEKELECDDTEYETESSYNEENEVPNTAFNLPRHIDSNIKCSSVRPEEESMFPSYAPCGKANAFQPNTSHCMPLPLMPSQMPVSQDSSLFALLSAWYMAGYYTGLHKGQQYSSYYAAPRSNHCYEPCHHRSCCNHHHHC